VKILPRRNKQSARSLPQVIPLEFSLGHWPGMGAQAGGHLRFLMRGLERSVRVSMKWESLALMREALSLAVEDDIILKRVLVTWGCEQVARLAADGKPVALANLVLDVDDAEARAILKRCRLLADGQALFDVDPTRKPSVSHAA
jgi:hypothetical protein